MVRLSGCQPGWVPARLPIYWVSADSQTPFLFTEALENMTTGGLMTPGQGFLQNPVPGLELMIAAGADANFTIPEIPNMPAQSPSKGDSLLMSLAHYAAKHGDKPTYSYVPWYVKEAAQVLLKHGADKDVKSSAAAYPDHAGKSIAEFAPEWFTNTATKDPCQRVRRQPV